MGLLLLLLLLRRRRRAWLQQSWRLSALRRRGRRRGPRPHRGRCPLQGPSARRAFEGSTRRAARGGQHAGGAHASGGYGLGILYLTAVSFEVWLGATLGIGDENVWYRLPFANTTCILLFVNSVSIRLVCVTQFPRRRRRRRRQSGIHSLSTKGRDSKNA